MSHRVIHYVALHRPSRCPPTPPTPPIASIFTLHCPFCRLLPRLYCHLSRRLGGWESLNSLRRIDLTIVSVIDQFTHIYLFRLHKGKCQKYGFEDTFFLALSGAYQTPIIRVVRPLLTAPISHSYVSYSRHGPFVLNRAGMHHYICPLHPEDEIRAAE